jgi:hypothetical protein
MLDCYEGAHVAAAVEPGVEMAIPITSPSLRFLCIVAVDGLKDNLKVKLMPSVIHVLGSCEL